MAAAAGDWSDMGVDRTRLVVEAARDMAVQRLSEGGVGELPGFPRSGGEGGEAGDEGCRRGSSTRRGASTSSCCVSSVSPLSTIMGIFTIEEGARSNTETLVLEEMMHLLSNTYEEMPTEACLLHIQ